MKSKIVLGSVLLGLLTFFLTFWAADRTPYLDDDYRYLFSFYSDAPLRNGELPSWDSFARIPNKWARMVEDVSRHYRLECGRFMSACVERPLSALPRKVFAAMAAVLFLAIALLTARLAGVGEGLPLYLAGFFVICYDWSTCAWLSGGCNYLTAAVAGCAAVGLFLRPRLQESVFAWRNLWFLALVPLGMLLAGWHEQLSVSLCLLMAVYWADAFFLKRRFAVDGRFLLSLGFGIGALIVVFAPGTSGRVAMVSFFTPEVSAAFSLARRLRCLARLVIANPAVLLAAAVSAGFVCSRRFRAKLDARSRWVLLAGWMMFLVTCLLTDGTQRRGWFAAVFSMMMTAVAIPLALTGIRASWRRAAGASVYALFAAVLAVTAVRVHEKSVAHAQDIAALKASPFCLVEYRPGLKTRVPVLDRSADYPITPGMPECWLRILPANLYGKEAMFAFSREGIELFLRPDLPEAMKLTALAQCPGWSEIPGSDFIFARHADPATALMGERLNGFPVYEKVPVRHDLNWLWRRFWKSDWADFSMMPPEDEMACDKPLVGFVILTPTGAYDVLLHSRFIPRSRILSIRVEKVDASTKFLWNT